MDTFQGKVAIVTGGASGIGRSLGAELARRGATVTLADVNAKLLEEAVQSIVKAGNRAQGVVLDVRDFDAVRKVVDDTTGQFGRLDYLFNNAGIAVVGDARDFSIDDWRKVIDTNLYGVVHGVASAYPVMVKQGFGHIINTSSLAGLVPAVGEISYVASKYGVVGLSHALRTEGADLGVRVSVVCPGFIDTPIFYNAELRKIDREKMRDAIPKALPSDECARVILHGVERNKATILVTRLAPLLWMLHRLSPGLMFRLSQRFVRQMREMRDKK